MNECIKYMKSTEYLKRIACIFKNRSHDGEKIGVFSCMKKHWIWIVVLMNVIAILYRYENQIWKHIYRLRRKEFWSGYISGLAQMVVVAILRMKPQPFGAQPQPKPLGSKPKPKPMMEVSIRSRR